MNDLIRTPQAPHSVASSEQSRLATEVAKMLSLVAPVTMSQDQQTAWLASAVDALAGIRADEVADVSLEVRRSVTRPSQIVPEVSRLVGEKRARWARIRELEPPPNALPPPPKHIMERDRSQFTANDWAELNQYLEKMGSPVRYSSDGRKIAA